MRKLYQKQDMEQHKIQDRIQIHRNTHTHTFFGKLSFWEMVYAW